MNMKLLEQYEEIVERSASEMSYAWKGSLVVTYFLSAVSSYTCTILFYTFWYDVCGSHCLFWAEVELQPMFSPNVTSGNNATSYDWTKDVLIAYHSQKHCNWFIFACMLSCLTAITLLMMFSICGKGGYDTSLFTAPWRIVMPAQVGSLSMMLVTMSAAHEFTHGYFHFSKNLYQLAYRILQSTNHPFRYNYPCEAFQTFIDSHNIYHFDSCGIYIMIKVSSWTMTWSWIGSFVILCLRVLTSADFNLLKVKIYEMPKNKSERLAIFERVRQGRTSIETQKRDDEISLKEKIL